MHSVKVVRVRVCACSQWRVDICTCTLNTRFWEGDTRHVNEFIAAVVALAWVAFRVLVRHHRAQRLHTITPTVKMMKASARSSSHVLTSTTYLASHDTVRDRSDSSSCTTEIQTGTNGT